MKKYNPTRQCQAVAISVLLLLSTLLPIGTARADGRDVQYQRIAGVLIGEGGTLGDDYDLLACVVRNRLARGWALASVLKPFNARYQPPSQEHINRLVAILNDTAADLPQECDAVYFVYADWYANRWIKPTVQPVVVADGNHFYRYEDYKSMW